VTGILLDLATQLGQILGGLALIVAVVTAFMLPLIGIAWLQERGGYWILERRLDSRIGEIGRESRVESRESFSAWQIGLKVSERRR